MESLVWDEKLDRIKAYYRDGCAHSTVLVKALLVCFNTHIELTWTEMSQTVCFGGVAEGLKAADCKSVL
jgi:hypothetical protein